ncbi:SDR family NAD(P)-dependent oxidoreductase [Demetria terragena]|uniref:SDR family NAD(P)-dependent oxidoreductase n=1 Tax=Demetria terragena TaxID=63959 RepID=UPI00035C750E|nr:SDR family NAD(P)-dependent oxidoreductase [Demetria terragena]
MSKPKSYQGAYAIVTGGASGFGQALTRLLHADGAHVMVVDVHEHAPEGALPAGVDYRQLDVRDQVGWDDLRNHVEATWGRLDLLVSNAGIAVGGRIDVAEIEEWDRAIQINLMGVVRGVRTFVPMMKQHGSGHLVQTASLAGLVHAPGMATYNTVKAGVVALSETLHYELSAHGVDVSVVCPSFFRTGLADSLAGKDVDLEHSAVSLITKAKRSADQVAAKAFSGMQKRTFLILPDEEAQIASRAKRFARPAYDRAMLRAGRDMGAGKSGTSALDRLGKLRNRRP